MALSVLHLVVILIATVTVGNCQNATFGECQPEKANCRECYLELVQAVLGRDDNVFNLSQIFTPPTFDHPNSVVVNYRFLNECNSSNNINPCIDETHTWIWAKSGAYLLHPLATFQFVSLLFGNAQPLYEREVYITLDATECYGASVDHITLLTQRLKIHIQEQSFYPILNNDYMPVAANSTTVIELLNDSPYTRATLSSEHILFFCPFFMTIIILALLVIVVVLYTCGGTCKFNSGVKANLKNQTKATVLAFTVISFIRILIFIGLDIAALHFNSPCSDPKVKGICEFSSLIHNTPGALLGYDMFALLFFVASIILAIFFPKLLKISGFQRCKRQYNLDPTSIYKCDQQNIQRLQYYFCTFSIMGFVFSCLIHSPYITMAYLSDAHYATSILIYYSLILFTEFGVFQYTFRVYLNSGSFNKKRKVLTGVCIFVQAILIYCLVLSVSLFYYYLPINNAVSNLPNEGIVVYQTALILVGAFITYKALFESRETKNTLQQLSQQIKESEMACLKSEIKYLRDENEIRMMQKKIVHLQKEIQLMHIKKKIRCLTDAPDDPIHPIKIARLKRQQSEILFYLKSEANSLETGPNHPNEQQQGDIKEEELYRLRSEILDHLLSRIRKVQLEKTIHDQDDIKKEITSLKRNVCTYLAKKKIHLNTFQQQQDFKVYFEEQISSIDEEIKHLDMVCKQCQPQQEEKSDDHAQNGEDQPLIPGEGPGDIEMTDMHPNTDQQIPIASE